MPKPKKSARKKLNKRFYNSYLFRVFIFVAIVIAVAAIAIIASRSQSTSNSSIDDGRKQADDFVQAISNCDFQKVQNYYFFSTAQQSRIDQFKQGCIKGSYQFTFYKNGPSDLSGKPDKDGISSKAATYIYGLKDIRTNTSNHVVIEMVWNQYDGWKVLLASATPN